MSWKFVTRTGLLAGDDFQKAKEIAGQTGYRFFLWHGDVYFLDSFGNAYNTGLTIDDLY